MTKQTLTILPCPHCELTTGHRVVQKDEYEDRVVVTFACTYCEAQQERQRDIPPPKEYHPYWLELTNTDDVYFRGKQGYGTLHKERTCVDKYMRPTNKLNVGDSVSWKVGRGAWTDVYVESKCEKCFPAEETDEQS